MRSLPLFHRIAGKRVVVVGAGEIAEAKRRLVERAGGMPCSEPEAHHASLAFVAVEERSEAEAVALRLRRAGLLVNVADRPDLCDFTTPSVLERDPVLVAIGTSGASAGLAKHLRLRLEALLPPSLGKLADKLHDARGKLRERFPQAQDRRRALDAALAPGGPLDPLSEHAAKRVGSWLDGVPPTAQGGQVEITLHSDDPDDLTLRQARLLGEADTVLFEPRVPADILARARADALYRPLPYEEAVPRGLTVILRR